MGRSNKAYQRLPESSEQILHPQKNLDSEPPLAVQDPELAGVLKDGYRLLKDDVLGEWMTYLILAFGADANAHIESTDGQQAAQGWGGDHYLVYSSKETGASILSAHWLWDSQGDAEKFQNTMRSYLDNRFIGGRLDVPGKDCWEIDQQCTCLFRKDNQVLWLLAPYQTTLDSLYTHYTSFH